MGESSKTLVFGATYGVIALFVAAVCAVQSTLMRTGRLAPGVAVGFAFAIVQASAALALFGCAWASKRWRRRRARLDAEAGPAIRERLASYCLGEGSLEGLRREYQKQPRAFEEAVLELLRVTQGAVRERIGELLDGSGLGAAWRRNAMSAWTERRRRALECLALAADRADAEIFRAALESKTRAVRMQGFRCVLALGRSEDLELAFTAAVREPLMARALMAQHLRKHCIELAQSAIPRVLREGNAAEIATALEFVAAWNRALPLDGVAGLCGHADSRVRTAALRALAVLLPADEARGAVLRSLSSEDPEEQRAAAMAAGALALPETELPLAGMVRSAEFPGALAAALAICRLGPGARDRLEREIASLEPRAASAVLEALDAFRTGRAARAGEA